MASVTALLVFGACGIASLLVDLDHPVAYRLGRDPRFTHKYTLLVACAVIIGCATYLGGLLAQQVLAS